MNIIRRMGSVFATVIAAVMVMTVYSPALAESPQMMQLNKYIADLKDNPDNTSLREELIKHAINMNPAPELTHDAERFMARGIAAIKTAESVDDFKDAVKEFEQATMAAPWFANAYYNLGIAQDKVGMYGAAIANLKWYLMASPDATDAKDVETQIYEIEYRQEKAARNASPESRFKAFLKKLDGSKWWWTGDHPNFTYYYELQGEELTLWTYYKPNMRDKDLLPGKAGTRTKGSTLRLNGYDFEYEEINGITYQGTVNEDGESITVKYRNPLYNKWMSDSYLRKQKVD